MFEVENEVKADRKCRIGGCVIPKGSRCIYHWAKGYGGKMQKFNICTSCISTLIAELEDHKQKLTELL